MGKFKPLTVAKNFITSPYTVGEVLPTSLKSARVMAQFISPEGETLEIGAGTGAVTAGILERLKNSSQLTCVEINREFATILKDNFPHVHVESADAADILKSHASFYDSIISTMPFGNFSAEKSRSFFQLIRKALRPHGVFVMIQYSLLSRRLLKEEFSQVKLAFSFFNIPPAVIYVCKDGVLH